MPRLPQGMAIFMPGLIRSRTASRPSSRWMTEGMSSGSMWEWSNFWLTRTMRGSVTVSHSCSTTLSLLLSNAMFFSFVSINRCCPHAIGNREAPIKVATSVNADTTKMGQV